MQVIVPSLIFKIVSSRGRAIRTISRELNDRIETQEEEKEVVKRRPPPQYLVNNFGSIRDEYLHLPPGQIGNYAGNEKVWRSGNEYAIRNRYSIPKEKCQACPLKSECLSARAKNRILTRTQGAKNGGHGRQKCERPKGNNEPAKGVES